MIEAIQFTLSTPTSANRLFTGDFHKRPEYRAWIKTAGLEIIEAKSRKPFKPLPKGWFATHTRHPIGARYDIDNAEKAIHDLLVSMRITPDDRHLFSGSYTRAVDVSHGTVEVLIWAVDDPLNAETRLPLGQIQV